MLNKVAWTRPGSQLAPDDQKTHAATGGIDLSEVVGLLRRQWFVVAGLLAVTVAAAVVYLAVTPASYTASAMMMIDTRKVQLFQQQAMMGDAAIDAGTVESQVEVIRSENIAHAVIRNLKLRNDPTFAGPGSMVAAAAGWLAALFDDDAVSASELHQERQAVETLKQNLEVKRLALTYVIEVNYRHNDPAKAAQIANAVAEAYIVDQLEAKYQATRRASVWLQDRIAELRAQAQDADRAVEDYKAKNNIVGAGTRLLNEQQMAEMSTQLILARANTAEARARFERVQEIKRDNLVEAAVTDVLKSDVIIRLRQQYLDASKREADWSVKYGKSHIAAVNLRNEMRELERVMDDELRRIGETYRSDYEIARVREESLQASLDDAIRQTASTNQDRVALRDLESSAQTYRNLYDNFLQRFTEATQQQSFPMTEARVITEATPPLRKSHPKTLLTVAIAGVLGLALGSGAAMARERLDNVFRSVTQVEQLTGVECLGILPTVDGKRPDPNVPADLAGRTLANELGTARFVVEQPFSRFSEGVRAIKVAADVAGLTRQSKTIGVVSALPHEGKTTVSSNLAQLIAHSGGRVLLVDSDLRNPSLTRTLAPKAEKGLIDILGKKATLEEVIWTDPVTGVHFVPAVLPTRIAHTSELVSSEAMRSFLAAAQDQYEYVVVDLPPIAPVVDVKAASYLIDSFVLVIEWGQTAREAVVEALNSAPGVSDKLLGAVLNKANPAVLKRLEAYKGRYYRSYYSQYGYTSS